MNGLPFELPKPIEPTTDEVAFRHWLKINRDHFAEGAYTSDEVSFIARLVGFDAELIYRELSHFQDAIAGSSIDNKIAMHLYTFEKAVQMVSRMKEDIAKKPERDIINPLWKSLTQYQIGESL